MSAPRRADKNEDAGGTQHPKRHVDQKHPAPVVLVGQPAAECGADDRAQYHAHAPDRHRFGVPLGWIDLQQHRLGQRDEGCSTDTLQQTIDHHFGKARGGTAESRGQGETGDRDEEHILDAKTAREPAGQRRHDRGRDDIGGHDPGDLVLGDRKTPLHVRQRDIGDRGVDPLHEGRQHDRDRDGAPVGNRGAGFAPHRSAARVVEPTSEAKNRSTRTSIGRSRRVSTSTVALNPACSGTFGSMWSMLMRTGRR